MQITFYILENNQKTGRKSICMDRLFDTEAEATLSQLSLILALLRHTVSYGGVENWDDWSNNHLKIPK